MGQSNRLQHKLWITCLFLIASLLSLRLCYLYLNNVNQFPIRTIKIIASYQHISRSQLQTILMPYQNSSFFTLKAHQLYTDLLHLEWVDTVDIERRWPDTLQITMKEKKPIAFWNNSLLTAKGEILHDVTSKSLPLPHLAGPPHSHQFVLDLYRSLNQHALSTCHLKIIQVNMHANQSIELQLENSIRLKLGKKEVMPRLHRFCKAYPQLSDNPSRLIYADLRYPHGMAIKWENEP